MEFPRTLGGFELTGELGAGAMGTVYRAVQTNLGRPVVIKTLHPHLAKNEDLIKRFQREAKSAATLQHPNTVQVIEYGQEHDLYFIAMEYVDGLDIKELLTEMGPFPPEVALLVLRDVCRGMEAAHGRGIIHRDIKPANLMITARGQVKVMDFGLAREILDTTELTAHGSIMGTAAYMAPEQARGETDLLDHRADIFSTGLVGYEIAAGRRAFPGQTQVAVFAAVLDGKIEPLDSVVQDLPEGYAQLVHWMAHQDLRERCPTMTAARDRLEEMVEAAGIRRAERWLGDFVQEARSRRGTPEAPVAAGGATIAPTEVFTTGDVSAETHVVDSSAGTVVAGVPPATDGPQSGKSGSDPGSSSERPPESDSSTSQHEPHQEAALAPAPQISAPQPAAAPRAGSSRRWAAILIPIVILAAALGLWKSGVFDSAVVEPIPLASITNLRVEERTHTTLTVSWIVPEAGSAAGSAIATEIRLGISPSRIDEDEWETTDLVADVPSPTPDRPQTHVIEGLDPNTRYFLALRTVDRTGGLSPISNLIDVTTEADPTPTPTPDEDPEPLARIVNLRAMSGTPTSITVSWTVPPTGTPPGSALAAETKLRLSRTRISEESWTDAERVAGVPPPTPEQPQAYVINGLDPETRYFLALRTMDGAGKLSPISNLLDVKTEATEATPIDETPIRPYTQDFSVSASDMYLSSLFVNGRLIENPRSRQVLQVELKEGNNVLRAMNEGLNLDKTFTYQLKRNDPNTKIVLYFDTGLVEARPR